MIGNLVSPVGPRPPTFPATAKKKKRKSAILRLEVVAVAAVAAAVAALQTKGADNAVYPVSNIMCLQSNPSHSFLAAGWKQEFPSLLPILWPVLGRFFEIIEYYFLHGLKTKKITTS